MRYKEIRYNLFTLDEKYYLAHCISADAKMGAGIALEFTRQHPCVKELRSQDLEVGRCYRTKKVFNLVSKKVYYGKPTYESITKCIEDMAQQCPLEGVEFLGMPKIGCGLDRLSWGKVSEIVKNVFADQDINIVICSI